MKRLNFIHITINLEAALWNKLQLILPSHLPHSPKRFKSKQMHKVSQWRSAKCLNRIWCLLGWLKYKMNSQARHSAVMKAMRSTQIVLGGQRGSKKNRQVSREDTRQTKSSSQFSSTSPSHKVVQTLKNQPKMNFNRHWISNSWIKICSKRKSNSRESIPRWHKRCFHNRPCANHNLNSFSHSTIFLLIIRQKNKIRHRTRGLYKEQAQKDSLMIHPQISLRPHRGHIKTSKTFISEVWEVNNKGMPYSSRNLLELFLLLLWESTNKRYTGDR